MKPSLPTVLLLAVLGAPIARAAPAKPPTQDRRATAAALFQQGIAAMQAGKTAEGCARLAESVATMPDSGAMGALAECDTALNRLSEAWELWRDLSTSAPTQELRDDAAKNAAALDKRLARVTFQLSGPAPANLVVTLNDTPVQVNEATEEHRVTPGKLVVTAAAPQIEPWTKTFDAKAGTTIEVEIPIVESRGAIHRRKRSRLIGWSLIGAGAVAVGVGAVFGVSASSDWSSAAASCGGDTTRCKSAGYATAQGQLNSARHAATISTWTTAGGLVAAAAGLAVYLSYRDPARAESRTAWRAAPMADSQTVGLVLTRSLP